jgi:caffeoyl-CoA O-methyltransferase
MSELVNSEAVAFAEAHTTPADGQLAEISAWTETHTAWPGMMSGLPEARLLEALIAAGGARSVLEIGTFTAFGTLTMAAALPEDGRVTTLEVDTEMAETARRHIEASAYGGRVSLLVGPALETLAGLEGPFDLVYIDANKAEYPDYYEAVVPKLSEHGVIVADNLFRAGATLDPNADDEGTRAMRGFARRVQEDSRVHNVLLTVGDGLMLVWRVRPAV